MKERTTNRIESDRHLAWSEYWVLCRVYEGWTHKKDFADVSNLSPIYFAQNMFSPKLSSSSRNYCSCYYDDLVKICFFSLNSFFSVRHLLPYVNYLLDMCYVLRGCALYGGGCQIVDIYYCDKWESKHFFLTEKLASILKGWCSDH